MDADDLVVVSVARAVVAYQARPHPGRERVPCAEGAIPASTSTRLYWSPFNHVVRNGALGVPFCSLFWVPSAGVSRVPSLTPARLRGTGQKWHFDLWVG